MPFTLAHNRNIYIPQGYFKSKEELKKVLVYQGISELFIRCCFNCITKHHTIIMEGGSSYKAAFETNIKRSECTHIDEIIGSRSIGEL